MEPEIVIKNYISQWSTEFRFYCYKQIIFFIRYIAMTKSSMRWAVHVARMGKTKNRDTIAVGKPERRTRRKYGNNIKMNLTRNRV
jgi:hypothetical protein